MPIKKKVASKSRPQSRPRSAGKDRTPAKKASTKKAPVKKTPARKAPAPDRSVDVTSSEALRALPPEYGDAPDMPVGVALVELASLHRLARSVGKRLERVGISAQRRESLGRFVTRLRALEAAWQRARTGVWLGAGERQKLADAEALNKKLLAGGRWALRRDAEALAELSRIAEGAGLYDTIADLRELAAFWARRTSALKHTDITARDLTRAVALADVLELCAAKETGSLTAAAALDLRNRCFWAADEVCIELREAGRYAFRLEPKIAAKFSSRYRASIKRRTRQKAKSLQPPAPLDR